MPIPLISSGGMSSACSRVRASLWMSCGLQPHTQAACKEAEVWTCQKTHSDVTRQVCLLKHS
jgi:hypothetical protein